MPTGQVRALPNSGQGDCLFRAVAHQLHLQAYGGALFTAPMLRSTAVDHLRANMAMYEPQILSLGLDMEDAGEILLPNGSVALRNTAILNTLALQQTMAGEESVTALSEALHVTIMVYQPHTDILWYRPNGESRGVVRLLRRGMHYESILEWRPNRVSISTSTEEVSASQICFSTFLHALEKGRIILTQNGFRHQREVFMLLHQ